MAQGIYEDEKLAHLWEPSARWLVQMVHQSVLLPSLLSSTSVPADVMEAVIGNTYQDEKARLQRHLLLDELRFR